MDQPKKRRGRPRKIQNSEATAKPKRGRGRPRKNTTAAGAVPTQKRKRGRPAKNETAAPVAKVGKRKRGRPPKIAQDFGTGREGKRLSIVPTAIADHGETHQDRADRVGDSGNLDNLDDLRAGLNAELNAFLKFLPAVFEKLKLRFEHQVDEIRRSLLQGRADHENDDSEYMMAAIQKAAGRLAAFRTEGNHSASELARLTRRLDKAIRRLGAEE